METNVLKVFIATETDVLGFYSDGNLCFRPGVFEIKPLSFLSKPPSEILDIYNG